MKTHWLICSVSVLFTVSGCSGDATSPEAKVDAASPEAPDPVKALEEIVKSFDEKRAWVRFREGSPDVDIKPSWVYRQITNTSVSYDVKKTESLVSPIIGAITIRQTIHYESDFSTAEQAAQCKKSDSNLEIKTGNYVWQDGKWELGSLEQQKVYADGTLGKKSVYQGVGLDVNDQVLAWPFVEQVFLNKYKFVTPQL